MKKLIITIFSLVLLFLGQNAYASVTWNTASNDCKTVSIANHETQEGYGYPCWPGNYISAEPGQSVNIRIYYHNTGTETANNTRVILNAPTINNISSTHTFTGQVISDQGSTSSFTVTANLTSPQKLNFGATSWYTENQSQTKTNLLYNQNDSAVINGGLNIGSIAPGWSTQGSVVVNFYVNKPMSGNLTASSSSCTISTGQNSCTIPFSWTTTNPIATSVVTREGGNTVATGNNGNSSFSIPFGSSTFRLSNNNIQLDTEIVTASCANGTTLNSNTGYCEQLKPNGALTASSSSCLISAGQGSCTIPFSWYTNNPNGVSSVTRDGAFGDYKTGNSGTNVPFSIPFGSSTFRLYNYSIELDTEAVSASCASGTSWNSLTSSCVLPVNNCEITSFTTNPTTSAPGDPVTLSWSTNYCNYVNISGAGNNLSPNGNKTVWPTTSTTYILTGFGDTSVQPTKTVSVTVGGPAGAPTFPAGAPTFGS